MPAAFCTRRIARAGWIPIRSESSVVVRRTNKRSVDREIIGNAPTMKRQKCNESLFGFDSPLFSSRSLLKNLCLATFAATPEKRQTYIPIPGKLYLPIVEQLSSNAFLNTRMPYVRKTREIVSFCSLAGGPLARVKLSPRLLLTCSLHGVVEHVGVVPLSCHGFLSRFFGGEENAP